MSRNLFLVDLKYVRPLEEVDAHREAHVEFLKVQYAAKNFIVSGPKQPRNGGVILAVADNRAALETILEKDPFKSEGLAIYAVTEFEPRMFAEDFQAVIDWS